MINVSRQDKASQDRQHRLMLISRHEHVLAAFVFVLASNGVDLSMHCRASNFTKAVKSEGASGGT